MSKTILSQVDGFTPLPDLLVTRYGLITAAVFGRMWRYCQMEDGICRASLETIAKELNVNRVTIMRHTDILVQDGFLKDTTPDLKNKPHIYADTGKVAMYNRFGMAAAVTLSDSTITLSDSHSNLKSLEDSNKKEVKKQKDRAAPPQPKATDFPELILYREVTELYPVKASWHSVVQRIFEVSKRLGRQPTREDLFPFYEAWCNRGWLKTSVNWLDYAVRGEMPNGKFSVKWNAPVPPAESPEDLARRRAEADRLFGVTT